MTEAVKPADEPLQEAYADVEPMPSYDDGWNDAVVAILAALDDQIAHGPAGDQYGVRIARDIVAAVAES